jgi:hypothetical protein
VDLSKTHTGYLHLRPLPPNSPTDARYDSVFSSLCYNNVQKKNFKNCSDVKEMCAYTHSHQCEREKMLLTEEEKNG